MEECFHYHMDCVYNTDTAPVEIRKWMKSYGVKGVPHIDIDSLTELPAVLVFTGINENGRSTSHILIRVHKGGQIEYCDLCVFGERSRNSVIFLNTWSMSNFYSFKYFELAKYMNTNHGTDFITKTSLLLQLATAMRPGICKMFDERQMLADFIAGKC